MTVFTCAHPCVCMCMHRCPCLAAPSPTVFSPSVALRERFGAVSIWKTVDIRYRTCMAAIVLLELELEWSSGWGSVAPRGSSTFSGSQAKPVSPASRLRSSSWPREADGGHSVASLPTGKVVFLSLSSIMKVHKEQGAR